METSNASRQVFNRLMGTLIQRRNFWLGLILLTALFGFESFNYSTTFTALNDLMGDMRFAGVRWATILALAFSAIDFAGIARLFSDDQNESGGKETWFLFVAWLLAATMNAILTWWGVSLALVNHSMASTSVIDPNLLMRAVPIFVAIMVWVTRILLISTISTAGPRFMTGEAPQLSNENAIVPVRSASLNTARPRPVQSSPAPLPVSTRAMRQNASTQRSSPPAEPAPRPVSSPARAAPSQSRPRPPEPQAPRPTASPPRSSTPSAPASRPAANPPRNAPSKPDPRPQRSQPPNNRSQRPQNTPPPPPPPPVDDDFEIDEPEYIPDPNYLPSNSAFHSLSARSKDNHNGATRQ